MDLKHKGLVNVANEKLSRPRWTIIWGRPDQVMTLKVLITIILCLLRLLHNGYEKWEVREMLYMMAY